MPRSITEHVLLAPYTTLGIGGEAEYFASIASEDDFLRALDWARGERLQVTVLGSGSNVLVSDEGMKGVVLHIESKGISYSEKNEGSAHVTLAAGERWDDVVLAVTTKGLWGIENLSGIPGTVGATPVQNINAYGASIGDTLVSVTAYHRATGEKKSFTKAECGLEYRGSYFKSPEGSEYIITEVVVELSSVRTIETAYRSSSQSIARWLHDNHIVDPTSSDVRQAVLAVRKNIGMLEGMYRSAGSFFKNTVVETALFTIVQERVKERHAEKDERFSPWHWKMEDGREKVSTAFLMECTPYNKTDFNGALFRERVGISPLHTLSIINAHDATANDVQEFVTVITDAVFKEFGVHIEREVCYLK